MRKIKYLFCSMALIILLLSFTGCNKTAPTVEDFRNIMTNAGYEVEDVTALEGDDDFVEIYDARKDDFEISFAIMADNETCERVYNNFEYELDQRYSVKYLSSKFKSSNSDYYAFNANDSFCLIARIDKTIIATVAPKAYRDEIKDFVNSLGY